MPSKKIMGLCGSLRRLSCNRGMLRAARELMGAGCRLDIAKLGDLPLYNMDIDPSGGGPGGGPNPYNVTEWPEAVGVLRKQFDAADGILVAVGENNGNIPAPLINALAWLSRAETRGDEKIRLPAGKVFALMGCAGGSGGRNGRLHCADLIGRLKGIVIEQYVDSQFFSDQYDLTSGDVVGAELKHEIGVLVDALAQNI